MKQSITTLLFVLLFYSCQSEEGTNNRLPDGGKLTEVIVNTEVLGMDGVSTRAIADEVKYVTAMFFDTATGLFYRSTSFAVVSNVYTFYLPANNWTIVLVGTGDGLAPTFTTGLVVGQTSLTNAMLTLGKNADNSYNTTREYFYASQVFTVQASTTTLPVMTLQRVVSKFQLITTKQLSDSLSRVRITLNNVVPSVNFNGQKNMNYTQQMIDTYASGKVNGIYSFTMYSFGSKSLGATANDFNISMDYVRISQPATLYNFLISNAADLKAGGMVINSKTIINMGL